MPPHPVFCDLSELPRKLTATQKRDGRELRPSLLGIGQWLGRWAVLALERQDNGSGCFPRFQRFMGFGDLSHRHGAANDWLYVTA